MSKMRRPVPREVRLSNGLTLVHLHTANDPISACHLFIPGGTGQEPQEKLGISTLSWSLLLKGTEKRSARQLAEDIESIGASLGAGATHDYAEISCHAISDYFLQALQIMSEALFTSVFIESEIEKEKAALIAAIRSKKESIFSVASESLNTNLFPNHPYARPSSGYEETVKNLTQYDLLDWRRKTMVPNGAILSVASNLPFDEVLKDVEKFFGPTHWPKSKKVISFSKKTLLPKKPVYIQKTEHFEQAYLLIGYPAPPVESDDYIPLKVLSAVLGGGMSARLFQQLREKEGLAYDVGAFYASKKHGSAFVSYMGLQASRLKEAKARILLALEDVRKKKIPLRELNEVKNYVKGTYILDHQTNSQRAHYLGWWRTLGLGPTFDGEYIKRLDRVTPAHVLAAAKRVFSKNTVTIEIIPEKFKKAAGDAA